MIKHYVTFYFPNILVADEYSRQVKSRKPEDLKIPKGAFMFEFYDREEVTVDKEVLVGKAKNFSKKYFIDGEVFTLAQVKKMFPEETVLITNMECNKWKKVICCNTGNFQPFKDDCVQWRTS